LFKAIFLLLVLLLFVLMGIAQRRHRDVPHATAGREVHPEIGHHVPRFFAVGFLTATVVMVGSGGKKGSSAKPARN
jgi:hypothetical protein